MNKAQLLEMLTHIVKQKEKKDCNEDESDILNEEEANTIKKCVHHSQIESEQLYGSYKDKSLKILSICSVICIINIFL